METSEVPHTNSTESAAAVQIAATGVRIFRADLRERLRARQPTVTRKGEDHARGRGHCRQPAKKLSKEHHEIDELFDAGLTRSSKPQKKTFQPCLAASSILGIISTKAQRKR